MNDKCWYKDVCERCNTDYCDCDCIRYFKVQYLLDASLLARDEQRVIPLVADPEDEEAFNTLRDIQLNIEQVVTEGRNLMLISKRTGNGKTEWCYKLMFSYIDSIWHKCELEPKVLFVNVPTLFNALRDNIDAKSDFVTKFKESVFTADLIIWDEVGVKSLTQFEHDNFITYIDRRIKSNKANIYTSNLGEDSLLEALGDRLYSRIVNSSKIIEFKGRDKRALNKW